MTTPPSIMQNLTMQLNKTFTDKQLSPYNIIEQKENIANWCYSQHFEFQYRGIYLIWFASLCLLIYTLMAEYDDKIPEFNKKFFKWDINKYETRKFLFEMARESIVIFLIIFLYQKYDLHFLDFLMKLIGFQ